MTHEIFIAAGILFSYCGLHANTAIEPGNYFLDQSVLPRVEPQTRGMVLLAGYTNMMEPSKLACLFKSWGHSREEDSDGLTVYRPQGFKFPPSRGRDGIEFQPDGTVMRIGPGPDDRSRAESGSWKSTDGNSFQVRLGGSEARPQRMTVVDCDEHVLRVRWD
jgi:hypothetical protein